MNYSKISYSKSTMPKDMQKDMLKDILNSIMLHINHYNYKLPNNRRKNMPLIKNNNFHKNKNLMVKRHKYNYQKRTNRF